MKIKTVDQEPCGQHTIWEPQCRTCRRLAELEGQVVALAAQLRTALQARPTAAEYETALTERDRLREALPKLECEMDAMSLTDHLRRFGPKAKEHPSAGEECPACHVRFVAGDYTTLVSLGPGSDPEARERAREGRAYTAVAVEVHWTCATGRA